MATCHGLPRRRTESGWQQMGIHEDNGTIQDGTVHGSVRERDASHDVEFGRVLEEMVRNRGR